MAEADDYCAGLFKIQKVPENMRHADLFSSYMRPLKYTGLMGLNDRIYKIQ